MVRRQTTVAVAVLALGQALPQAQETREVTYHARTIVPVHAKVRFTTLIILPEHEEILDFVCGDTDFWVVSGTHNLAYVKPAKEGIATNLNLVTASGNVYSFLLTEGAGEPDLRLTVVVNETMARRLADPPTFYSAVQVEALQREIDTARLEVEAARREVDTVRDAAALTTDETIAHFRATYPTELSFRYRFKADEKPFRVSAIFHDGRFTYIHSDATELPALYELLDGAANLVSFQVEHGVYVVPKVVEHGYLAIGTRRFFFKLDDEE